MAYPGQPMGGQAAAPWQPNQGGEAGGYKWDDGPDTDPEDDDNRTEPIQGDPTNITGVEGYQPIQGYENVGFGTGSAAPPPPYQPPPDTEKPQEVYSSAASISEEEARDAMIRFVNQNCCYGSKPAKEMNIESIAPSSALHYELETFTESRSTSRAWVPYNGYDPVDGPMNGYPPPLWEIVCSPNMLFADEVREMEIPHTAFVLPCHGCNAMGFNRCYRCYGRGRVRCRTCGADGRVWRTNAEGHRYQDRCDYCMGTGRRRCDTCGGDGRITCNACRGYRMIKHYIKLTVRFTNHKSDYIMEKTDMPDHLIREVSGVTVFEQTLPYVWPISSYPVPEINNNSIRIVNEHRSAFASERQIQQRQQLRAVPVTECMYQWKDTRTRFWVYGNERDVHAPDYPQQCCCGCSIL
ncbi:protein SSUH2 homolog [Ptychodera flava]|uniref:protein SSUH2 homolog n=1 Tax=Ptychodera flava TaxID=63121 RepID=UPI003969F024